MKLRKRSDLFSYLKSNSLLEKEVICFLDNRNRIFFHKIIKKLVSLKYEVFFPAIELSSENIILYLKQNKNSETLIKSLEKESQLLHINIVDIIFY